MNSSNFKWIGNMVLSVVAATCAAACGGVVHPDMEASADVQQSQDLGNQDTGGGTDVTADSQQDTDVVKPECAVDNDCDDKNACTTEVCGNGKCVHINNSEQCNDYNDCTEKDACTGGACIGQMKVCEDNNPCTIDACAGGTCLNLANDVTCNDGDACTGNDNCAGGKCQGTTINCDDNNICTTEVCDSKKGCVSSDMVCNDDDPCTMDSCKDGACKFELNLCDDGLEKTNDWCSWKGFEAKDGFECIHSQKWGWCDKDADCQGGIYNPCFPDTCVQNQCQTTIKFCNDQNPCTKNVQVVSGDICTCSFPVDTLPCNDYNPCTVDTCDPIMGCSHNSNPGLCNDNNPNTVDSCAPSTGCVHTPVVNPSPNPGSGNTTCHGGLANEYSPANAAKISSCTGFAAAGGSLAQLGNNLEKVVGSSGQTIVRAVSGFNGVCAIVCYDSVGADVAPLTCDATWVPGGLSDVPMYQTKGCCALPGSGAKGCAWDAKCNASCP